MTTNNTSETISGSELQSLAKKGKHVERVALVWAALSGQDRFDATFHYQTGFQRAIDAGRDITVRIAEEKDRRFVEVTDGKFSDRFPL